MNWTNKNGQVNKSIILFFFIFDFKHVFVFNRIWTVYTVLFSSLRYIYLSHAHDLKNVHSIICHTVQSPFWLLFFSVFRSRALSFRRKCKQQTKRKNKQVRRNRKKKQQITLCEIQPSATHTNIIQASVHHTHAYMI